MASLYLHPRDIRRTALISDAGRWEGREVTLCGRLSGEPGDYSLKDESGSLPVSLVGSGLEDQIRPNDLVELTGVVREGVLQVIGCRVVVPSRTEEGQRRWRWWQLASDLEAMQLLRLRSAFLNKIRQFFLDQGFVEIDAPALVSAAGMEPHIEPFHSSLKAPSGEKTPVFLHTSPEYVMKKMLVAGFEKIFFLGHVFRNGELSRTHSPEFTMLEWYRAYQDYHSLMKDCEELVQFLWSELHPTWERLLRRDDLLLRAWQRQDLRLLFKQRLDIELTGDSKKDRERLMEPVRKRKLASEPERLTVDDLFFLLFLNLIEADLGKNQPEFLIQYPIWMASLARRSPDNSSFVERFELYIDGLELANAFTELNDWQEQEERLWEEQRLRKTLGRIPIPIDAEFIQALKFGMPPAAGIALGVDRLLMVFTDSQDIWGLFPFSPQSLRQNE